MSEFCSVPVGVFEGSAIGEGDWEVWGDEGVGLKFGQRGADGSR